MQDETEQLKSRIEVLERWKAERERQQITFPLDDLSIRVLTKHFMRIIGSVVYLGGPIGGNDIVLYKGIQDDLEFLVAKDDYIPYTANATNDTLTVQKGRFDEGRVVTVYSSDTTPTPLASGNIYFVMNTNSTGRIFQLSEDPAYAVSSVSTGADTITTSSAFFVNDDTVYVASSGSIPAGLSLLTKYFVVNAAGATFQLSTTLGGSAINLTSAGSGAITVQTSPINLTDTGVGRQYISFLVQ